jgi:hypothetical protein
MVVYPKDELGVPFMPAISDMVVEKAIGSLVMRITAQDPKELVRRMNCIDILLPDDGQEKRTSRVHNRKIGEYQIAIVCLQWIDDGEVKRMARRSAKSIIRDSDRSCPASTCWIRKKEIEAAMGFDIEVEVDATVVVEEKVAKGIDSLDRIRIRIVVMQKTGVVFGNEGECELVGPELRKVSAQSFLVCSVRLQTIYA